MATTRSRPLSPHLSIWRWGPNMAASIFHRASGIALTIGGLAVLTWWLWALSNGPDAYANFAAAAKHPLGIVVMVGLTWSFFQHLLTGVRHLIMDTGAIFELQINKTSAVLTFIGAVVLTALVWAYFLGVAK
ncbi:MAG: succinate dehydrogenase, cytochrome b556 subunit [Bradyrhizobium sp.]|nr:succinate dehydrogenase, cytochrome b556 subunit [Bradyrhizobium sp.]